MQLAPCGVLGIIKSSYTQVSDCSLYDIYTSYNVCVCVCVHAQSRDQDRGLANVKLRVAARVCVCLRVRVSSAFASRLFLTRGSRWRSACGSWEVRPAGRGHPGRWCRGWAGRCLSRARCATASILWRFGSTGQGPPGGNRSLLAPTLWPVGEKRYRIKSSRCFFV